MTQVEEEVWRLAGGEQRLQQDEGLETSAEKDIKGWCLGAIAVFSHEGPPIGALWFWASQNTFWVLPSPPASVSLAYMNECSLKLHQRMGDARYQTVGAGGSSSEGCFGIWQCPGFLKMYQHLKGK